MMDKKDILQKSHLKLTEVKVLKLKSKFWLECEGVKVFGLGPCTLLEAVDRLGTLNQASKELNMSYSKAWSIINRAESKLGFPLLVCQAGGIDGGGSDLTPEAKKLIKSYRQFCLKADRLLDQLYAEYFNCIFY